MKRPTTQRAVESVIVFNPEQRGCRRKLYAARNVSHADPALRPMHVLNVGPRGRAISARPRLHPAPAACHPVTRKAFLTSHTLHCRRCFCVKMFPSNLFVVVVSL